MISKKDDVFKIIFLRRKYQTMFLYSCMAMVLIFIFYTCVQTEGNQEASQDINLPRKRKLFLLWTSYFNERDWLPSTRDLNCPIPECDVTSNRSLLANSSAVIMHWRNIDSNDLPECVDRKQNSTEPPCPAMVLFNKEAPLNTPAESIQKINNKIHLMATYRRDSDIYAPYGNIVKNKNAYKMPDLNLDRNTVCWLVSHCHTPSTSEVYVDELRRYINVVIYGKCGYKTCPYENVLECYKWLSKRCKFYLSFENSICKDYATEKLYYAMMTDMVPVVLGGEDYARYLPSHSFIDVADFSSPRALAEYLKNLDKDQSLYLSYFKWKKNLMATFVPFLWFCDLCEYFHKKSVDNLKPYEDVRTWWFDGSNCGSALYSS